MKNFILMNPEGGGDVSGQGGGAGEATPPVGEGAPPSALPSDVTAGEIDLTGFEISDDIKSQFKDGKLNGRFSSMQEVLDTLKSIEDKHSNLNRDLSDKQKADLASIEATANQTKTEQAKVTLVEQLVPEFLKNGMIVTPEMSAQLTEVGLTEAEIKLGAYEFKDALVKNQNYVGGEENYKIIMEHHASNMTDDQKVAFNHSIQNPANSEALMVGLQAMYEKDVANGTGDNQQTPDRFRGEVAPAQSVRGYESRTELFKDKAYIDSPTGRQDAGAIAKYRAKLAITNDSVWK